MVKALLIKRNTPDPGCKLSPAEVVFGRKLKDTLPYGGLQSGPTVYENKDIDRMWRDTWKLKEQALKQRYIKSVEKLEKNSKLLPPLRIGDKVLVQNQAGRFATKWDKTGRVVEIHPHDQYSVKIDGSGRLSLRNRQFLRKMTEHKLFNDEKPVIYSHDHQTNLNQKSLVPTPSISSSPEESDNTSVPQDSQDNQINTDRLTDPPIISSDYSDSRSPLAINASSTQHCSPPNASYPAIHEHWRSRL